MNNQQIIKVKYANFIVIVMFGSKATIQRGFTLCRAFTSEMYNLEHGSNNHSIIQCVTGGGGEGTGLCGEHIHCVFDQIPNLQNCFSTLNKKPRRGGGLKQINICRQDPIQVNFKGKPTFTVWCLYRYFVHDLENIVSFIPSLRVQ